MEVFICTGSQEPGARNKGEWGSESQMSPLAPTEGCHSCLRGKCGLFCATAPCPLPPPKQIRSSGVHFFPALFIAEFPLPTPVSGYNGCSIPI